MDFLIFIGSDVRVTIDGLWSFEQFDMDIERFRTGCGMVIKDML